MSKVTQSAKDDAYERGVRDAEKGVYNPPKGDGLVDFVFGPVDALAGSPSTGELARETKSDYNAGHSNGSRNRND
jgi:hypothetical protein